LSFADEISNIAPNVKRINKMLFISYFIYLAEDKAFKIKNHNKIRAFLKKLFKVLKNYFLLVDQMICYFFCLIKRRYVTSFA
jgi:hypothetical protein